MARSLSNVVAFDDAPAPPRHRGDVPLVGAVFARTRLDGVLIDRVRYDGRNSTHTIVSMLEGSQFARHVQAVVLQGIAFAGFNVVDVHALHAELGLPVLVVARHAPDLAAMRRALLGRVRGGGEKWRLIEQAGPMEELERVYVQRIGLERERARRFLVESTIHGALPEPLRAAHLIAGALGTGRSRGRA